MDFPAVAGLDPSMTSTGLAVLEYLECDRLPFEHVERPRPFVRTHRIKSKPEPKATWEQRRIRLGKIRDEVVSRIPRGSLVVVEGPSYGSTGGSAFDRAGLWWAIHDALRENQCVIIPAAPAQRMKYATGKGVADKDTVMAAAVRRYLEISIEGNDVADGVLFMAMGARIIGRPIETDLPASHAIATSKLIIPTYERG